MQQTLIAVHLQFRKVVINPKISLFLGPLFRALSHAGRPRPAHASLYFRWQLSPYQSIFHIYIPLGEHRQATAQLAPLHARTRAFSYLARRRV